MATVDLWPADIGQITETRGLTALLQEQAGLLSEKTQGLVTAEVKSGASAHDDTFSDRFYLVGPRLGYHYLLFTVTYPLSDFPAKVRAEALEREVSIADAEMLGETLAEIFSNEKTRRVIGAIISRSKRDAE